MGAHTVLLEAPVGIGEQAIEKDRGLHNTCGVRVLLCRVTKGRVSRGSPRVCKGKFFAEGDEWRGRGRGERRRRREGEGEKEQEKEQELAVNLEGEGRGQQRDGGRDGGGGWRE